MGLGSQDNFEYAQNFLNSTDVKTPPMLWDPRGDTWRTFGVQANSQMLVLASDLSRGSSLIYGFDDAKQAFILDSIDDFIVAP